MVFPLEELRNVVSRLATGNVDSLKEFSLSPV